MCVVMWYYPDHLWSNCKVNILAYYPQLREGTSWKCTHMQVALGQDTVQIHNSLLTFEHCVGSAKSTVFGSLNGICTHLPSGSGRTTSLNCFKFNSHLPKKNSTLFLLFPSVSSSFPQMIFAHPGSLTLSLLPAGSRDLLTRTSTPRFLFTSLLGGSSPPTLGRRPSGKIR